MDFAIHAVTKTVTADRTHAIRNCIICGADNASPQFTFTTDFLTRVRGMTVKDLRTKGWNDSTTSSIVRCRQCGCNYIRDVFIADEQGESFERVLDEQAMVNSTTKHVKQFSFQNINHLEFCRRVVAMLLRYLVEHRSPATEVSLLDFGCSLSIVSKMAKVCGFDCVVSYDPKFHSSYVDRLNTIESPHPLGIQYVNDPVELDRRAPFDAIVCQSAIEHFYDPRAELQRMRRLLADDGILYIDSPIMPLDRERPLLAREADIADPRIRGTLQKSYHIDHLNYLLPRHFVRLLRDAGFVERRALFYVPAPRGGASENAIRFAKASANYALDLVGAKFRKVYFFAVKKR